MAFRAEARAGALIVVLGAALWGQPSSFEVKHEHLRGAGAGTLAIGETGISFREPKRESHSRSWVWENIQQLTLERGRITLLTYEDVKLELWRDREFVFFDLPGPAASTLAPYLRMHLGSRLIAATADIGIPGEWQLPVKLLRARRGAEGVLRFSPGLIAFDTDRADEPRMWSYGDIETLTHPSPFELSLTVRERRGLRRLSTTEYRFQLKEPMPEERYQALWREMNRQRTGAAPSPAGPEIRMPGHGTAPPDEIRKWR